MLNRILPAPIDNRYRGHMLALWFFVPDHLNEGGGEPRPFMKVSSNHRRSSS